MTSYSKKQILCEFKKLLYLAGPLIIMNMLVCASSMISLVFVGHLGKLALSGASVATSFVSVTGLSLTVGLSTALETLCDQSFGAAQYHLLGIHMQRAMIVLSSVSVPLAVMWFYAEKMLVFLRQDPEISAEAGLYRRYLIPCLFADALLQCLVRFLQSQKNVIPMMLTTGIMTSLHVLICWIKVFKFGLGSKGAALANAISLWINVMFLSVYVRVSPSCKKTWTGFSKEAFLKIPTYLKLAVPSAIMICLEIWSFQMMVNPQFEASVLSISLNIATMMYQVPLGLGDATSVRVSNELGACGAIILISGRKLWGYCYSSDKKVVSYIAQMLLLVAGSHIIDGIQSVLSGAVRGSGRQKIGAIMNLGSYYLIRIPLAVLFAFAFHLGLWLGIIAALISQGLSLSILTLRTNWESLANKATHRVNDSIIRDESIVATNVNEEETSRTETTQCVENQNMVHECYRNKKDTSNYP
uniref:protein DETOXIFICATION 16-like n=1 Tax=Erigeron canadensis TaxID=72917 RepID=UPI001CB8E977|nr:protein DETOXIFICATION 16-like [Erigeron canadensis]